MLVTPPLLCIEVLAPEDTWPDVLRRGDLFQRMGVQHIWAIDPRKRLGWYASTRGFEQVIDGTLRLSGTSVSVELTLAELFAKLDES